MMYSGTVQMGYHWQLSHFLPDGKQNLIVSEQRATSAL